MPHVTIKHNAAPHSVTRMNQNATLPTSVNSDSALDIQTLTRFKSSATAFLQSLEQKSVTSKFSPAIVSTIKGFIEAGLQSLESLGNLNLDPVTKFLAFCAQLPEQAAQGRSTREWRSFEAALKSFLADGNEVVRRTLDRELQKRTISFSLLGTNEDIGRFGPELREVIRDTLETQQIALAQKYGWNVIRDESGELLRIVAPAGHLLKPVRPLPNLDDPQVCTMLVRDLSRSVAVDGSSDTDDSPEED